MTASPLRDQICAVIVAFNPGQDFRDCAPRISGQVGGVIIVDNSTDAKAAGAVRNTAGACGAELLPLGKNMGVAAALNAGIERAAQRGFAYALLLDQDTIPHHDMAERLLATWQSASLQFQPEGGHVAMVGTNPLRFKGSKGGSPPGTNQDWSLSKTLITSGCLISITVFRSIGPFLETLFIDLVDTEYCLRAGSRGFQIVAVGRPVMDHKIGTPSAHWLGWRTAHTSNHPPVRRYYMSRNLILLLRKYFTDEPWYMTFTAWSWVKSTVLMLLFESNRGAKLKALAAGIIDGWKASHNSTLICQIAAEPPRTEE
jgi:rhamnosyltransferase